MNFQLIRSKKKQRSTSRQSREITTNTEKINYNLKILQLYVNVFYKVCEIVSRKMILPKLAEDIMEDTEKKIF